MKAQRIRITFGRAGDMKYITHLDMMRFWERALRRASIPVAYSEGFSPHAQISIAAPLAVGVTSEAELMDVFLERAMPPKQVIAQLSAQVPVGFSVLAAQEVSMTLPALQADVRFAEYEVDVSFEDALDAVRIDGPPPVATPRAARDVPAAVEAFLAAEEIPWEHKRENDVRSYDIRAQVDALSAEIIDDMSVRLRMRLQNDNSGSGRPEQVAAAIGLPSPRRIHRTKIILQARSTARQAWRKLGRFD